MEADNRYWKIVSNILVGSATITMGIGLLGQSIIEKLMSLKNSVKVWLKDDDMKPMIIMEKEDEKITIQDNQEGYVYQTPLRPNL